MGRERAEVFTYVVDPTASSWGAPFFCCSCSPIRSPIRSPHPSSSVFISSRKCFEAGRDDMTTREPMRRRSSAFGEEHCFRLPYCVTRGEGILLSAFVQVRGNKREWLRASPRTHSPRRKIEVTRKSPFGDISVVTLIRTDTILDHSQKAEKVCRCSGPPGAKMGWSRCPVPPSSPLHTPPDPAPPGDKEGRARGERAGGKREAGGHDVGERRALAAARKQAAS